MDLKPGTWITMIYGSNRLLFYVVNIYPDRVEMGRRCWCSTDTIQAECSPPDYSYSSIEIIGYGKLRCWWRWLPPFIRWAFCPFTKAKAEFTND